MPHPILITPSILSADLAHLQDDIDSIEPFADTIQVDVMDGHFVPNLSFGAPVMKCIKTKLPLDVHLMVTNPADRVDEFVAAGAAHITFHAEAVEDAKEQIKLIEYIRNKGCTAGIAVNPDTPLSVLNPLFEPSLVSARDDTVNTAEPPNPQTSKPPFDLFLAMTVVPGFSGQKFRDDVLPKITEFANAHPEIPIQVDGGVNAETAKLCREAGATNLVAASAIFGAEDKEAAIAAIRG